MDGRSADPLGHLVINTPMRPPLVRFGDLRREHFLAHPVWVSCHSVDCDEEWYADTDEETFRPVSEGQVVDPTAAMYLVAAEVTLADGTRLDGFLTPAPPGADMGSWQPQVFTEDGGMLGFWRGMAGVSAAELADAYRRLGRAAASVFPARVRPRKALGADSDIAIEGFYQLVRLGVPPVIHR